jgi:protein-tyrosine kinase
LAKDLLDQTTATDSAAAAREQWRLPSHVAKELAVMVDPAAPVSRALQSVTSQLQHMYVDGGVRSFCFIGDSSRSGTTVVTANVAAAFSISGQRTLLIETNFRSPRLAKMFGLDPTLPGLSEWLAGIGDVGSWTSYMQLASPGLIVIPAGNALKDAEAKLATELRPLMLELSRMFDVVLCDAAPMTEVSSTLAVISTVERTVIVARANKTRLKALLEFQETVRQCGGQVGGVVYLEF